MRLDIPVDVALTGRGAEGIAREAVHAEQAGFGRLWAAELQRSATIPLAVAAAHTTRIGLGTGVALAFTRSPFVLALETLDLDELSGGRMTLGLGAGVRRLNRSWHGAEYDPPIARMRELVAATTELISAMAEGRDASSPGEHYDISVVGYRRATDYPRTAIPVWIAAVLPGMARLAGRRADGFLDHPVTTPAWLNERLLPAIAEGARRGDRDLPEVSAAMICAVDDDDPARARQAAACTVGFYASVRTYAELFTEAGFGDRLAGVRRAFLDGDADSLAAAVGPDMTARFAAAGAVSEVRDAVADHVAACDRCDRLWATPPHHLQSSADTAGWQAGIRAALGAGGP
jgi:probable F420-dependent oxidoreductase